MATVGVGTQFRRWDGAGSWDKIAEVVNIDGRGNAIVPSLFFPTDGPFPIDRPASNMAALTCGALEYVVRTECSHIRLQTFLKNSTVHNSGFFDGEKGS